MSFFSELKRRNVFRVGIAYGVVAWLVAQILQLVFQTFAAPDWVMKAVLVLLAAGFVFAVFFSWAFELTPEGLKREGEVARAASIVNRTGKKLDVLIISVLVLALAYFALDKFLLDPARDAELVHSTTASVTEQITAAAPQSTSPDQSIAVLPFVNMSDDKDYFADGLSEELLNLLAKIPDLKVAGRTSSFAFKGKNEDLRIIGDALSVSHVLEGSVRRSGERLRITAQLIKVDDGFHMWSETYDREMADIFDIQDEVSRAITEELKLHLSVAADRPTGNSEAYALYLQALPLSIEFREDAIDQGLALLDQAIALDPSFAKAWELKAVYYWLAGGWAMDNVEAQRLTFAAATKALELDSSLNQARSFAITADPENWSWSSEIKALEALVSAEPHNINAMLALSYGLKNIGYFDEAIALADRAIELEPLAGYAYLRRGEALSAAGRREEAQAEWLKAGELGYESAYWQLAADQLITGNDEQAEDYFVTLSQVAGLDSEKFSDLIENARNPESGKEFLDKWIKDALANTSNIGETIDAYLWYLIFGYLDDYFAAIGTFRSEDSSWTNADAMEHLGMVLRASGYAAHPAYLKLAEADDLFDFWDQRGVPDHCEKVSRAWVCY